MDTIDKHGFRPNVGIILADGRGHLLWAKRIGRNAWQFPQGGIDAGENPEQALFRELYEEVGLEAVDVEVLAQTQGWLHYRLPYRYIRHDSRPLCVGQKQKWFLLRLTGSEERIRFDRGHKPEFDRWRWVSYWYPLGQIIEFKRDVYRRALQELVQVHTSLESRQLDLQRQAGNPRQRA